VEKKKIDKDTEVKELTSKWEVLSRDSAVISAAIQYKKSKEIISKKLDNEKVAINYGIQIAWASIGPFVGALGESIKMLFTGEATVNDLAGPVGVANIVSQTSNLTEYLYLLSVISLSLGITNLIPIPPLDGGKFLIYIIEWVKRKPLKEETTLKIQMAGFIFIIGLSMFVMYNDIVKIL